MARARARPPRTWSLLPPRERRRYVTALLASYWRPPRSARAVVTLPRRAVPRRRRELGAWGDPEVGEGGRG